MADINAVLRKELILLRKGDESTLPDFTRRRSTFVFSQQRRSRDGSSKSFAESVESILTEPLKDGTSPKLKRNKRSCPSLFDLTKLDLASLDNSIVSVDHNSQSSIPGKMNGS
jgi:hypothetical protein